MKRAKDPRQQDLASRPQREAADPARHVWVSANAGSGKTRVLTQRVLRLLLEDDGLAPGDIMALTFTKAVAQEMTARLGAEILGWAAMDDARLEAALAEILGEAPGARRMARARALPKAMTEGAPFIGTLHGLGQAVLQRFPHEAKVRADFAVLDNASQKRLLREALEEALATADADASAALEVLLDVLSDRALEEMGQMMLSAWPKLNALLEGEGGLAGAAARLALALGVADGKDYPDAGQARPLLQAWESAVLATGGKQDSEAAEKIGAVLSRGGKADWRALFFTKKGEECSPTTLASKRAWEMLGARREEVLALQRQVIGAVDHEKARNVYLSTLALLTWGAHVKACYEKLKAARGALDFNDLIVKLRGLLTSTDGEWVRFRLDRRIRHLLLDEGQDNSPLQHEVFWLLAKELLSGDGDSSGRTVFAVGDLKQSIYRFQGAQPGQFLQLRERMEEHGGEVFKAVELTHSFRTAPAVLAAVDAVFEDPLRAQAVLGDKMSPWPTHLSVYTGAPGRVEVWPVVDKVLRPKDEAKGWPSPGPDEAPEGGIVVVARRVAEDIRALVDGRIMLPSEGAPARYKDMLVLAQRNAPAAQVAAALAQAGIPVRLVGGNDEPPPLVADLAAWLRAMANGEDRVALATVLKSPLVGWSDARLMRLHAVAGDGNWWGGVAEVDAAAAAWLAEGRAMLEGHTPHDALAWVAEERDVTARYNESSAVVDDLLAVALGVIEPLALVALLEEQEVELSPAADGDAVRVMTVHKAKGLEAPVVYLVDTTASCQDTSKDKLLWREDASGKPDMVAVWPPEKDCPAALRPLEDAELARLSADSLRSLYVALTRPRDRLVVAGHWGKSNPFKVDAAGLPVSWYGAVASVAQAWPEAGGMRVLDGGEMPPGASPSAAGPPAPARPAWWDGVAVAETRRNTGTPALRRGTVVHEALLAMAAAEPLQRPEVGAARVFALAPEWDGAARAEAVAEAAGVIAALPEFFGPGSWGERSMAVEGGLGRADRIARTADGWWVLDFKTEAEVPDTVPAAYRHQLEGYRAALREVAGGAPVRAAVVWTRTAAVAEIGGD